MPGPLGSWKPKPHDHDDDDEDLGESSKYHEHPNAIQPLLRGCTRSTFLRTTPQKEGFPWRQFNLFCSRRRKPPSTPRNQMNPQRRPKKPTSRAWSKDVRLVEAACCRCLPWDGRLRDSNEDLVLYLHMRIYMYIHTRTYKHIYTYTHMHISIRTHSLSTYIYIWYTSIYVCMCTYVYIHIYIYTYTVYIYMHIFHIKTP